MENQDMVSDDLLVFTEEEDELLENEPLSFWDVLIVDDEPEVHNSTLFALSDLTILGRTIKFQSAYSAEEAKDLLREGETRFACILVDVVMESEDAGLKLVNYIREELCIEITRIILRTGQPGYAPELDVIRRYDINDYKSKSELTSTRMITTMISAIRGYHQLEMLESNRKGLTMIIDGASQMFREHAIETFSKGVLIQFCTLLQIEKNGFMCCLEDSHEKRVKVVAAFGNYESYCNQDLEGIENQQLRTEVKQVMQTQRNLIAESNVLLYLNPQNSNALVVRLETRRRLSELDVKLIELFSVHVAMGYDNAKLFQKIEYLAYYDSLTGLPNRTGFIDKFKNSLNAEGKGLVVIADINSFQAVNDGLGRKFGDESLKKAAQCLKSYFSESVTIARIGADTFSLCLPYDAQQDFKVYLQELNTSLSHGVTIEGHEIPISFTFGVSQYPEQGEDMETLLQNANIALKSAKNIQRGGVKVFSNEYESELQRRLQIATELRHCVERNELVVHYQPQISLKTGKVIGVEALMRWKRGDRLVPPDSFIPIAESSGHIIEMGGWILHEALSQQVKWRNELGIELRMAVNVSIRQLRDPAFLKVLSKAIEDTKIDPSSVEVEITESMFMEDSQLLITSLEAIRALGVMIAMDDFGTGYSSLSYLRMLPIDRLKVDRAFIRKIAVEREDRDFADLIIRMGHLVNLDVIAEGVESPNDVDVLNQLHCDEAQGFYFSKPLPALELEEKCLLK